MLERTNADMREEFDKLVAAGKIHRQHIDPLLALVQAGFCTHRSWGFGRIASTDTVFARFTIDFPGKAGHSMDLAFAAESLKPINKDHILARKSADIAGLRTMAARNHLELILLVVKSFGGRATLDQVQQMLVPDVITEDWKKWWEVARHELKKDGHFVVPLKKTDPIIYTAQEVQLHSRLLTEFKAAKGLKARLNVATETFRSLQDIQDPKPLALEVVNTLNLDIQSHQRTQPAVALEAIFARDDLKAAAGLSGVPDDISAKDIWTQGTKIGPVLELMPAAKHKRTLLSFKEVYPETWATTLLGVMNVLASKVCTECANLLIHEGHLDKLKEMMARVISQHTANSELLLWLAKERSDSFADILGPEVFRSMLTAIERDQFNERKSNRLRDYVLSDAELLVELIRSADIEVIKDLTRALQLSPSFDDMDKRSLLARIVKSYPPIQTLISGEATRQESNLLVSWESLERRKKEYEELVQRKIPANSRDIAIARSYGDLRENHEYKAAKENHRVLMRRKAELEIELVRARGTDFSKPRTDVVSIGTIATLTDLQANVVERYTIVGAWDGQPEQQIVSYLTPIGQAMLNHKLGEEVEFEIDGNKRRFRIDGVESANLPPPNADDSTPEPAGTPPA